MVGRPRSFQVLDEDEVSSSKSGLVPDLVARTSGAAPSRILINFNPFTLFLPPPPPPPPLTNLPHVRLSILSLQRLCKHLRTRLGLVYNTCRLPGIDCTQASRMGPFSSVACRTRVMAQEDQGKRMAYSPLRLHSPHVWALPPLFPKSPLNVQLVFLISLY